VALGLARCQSQAVSAAHVTKQGPSRTSVAGFVRSQPSRRSKEYESDSNAGGACCPGPEFPDKRNLQQRLPTVQLLIIAVVAYAAIT
jgi:hypothetical protein